MIIGPYITNAPIPTAEESVFSANARCDQEQAKRTQAGSES